MTFTDIDNNFTLTASGDLKLVTDVDAISQALRNLILTPTGFRAGEYYLNDTYGVGIKEYLFEKVNSSSATSIQEDLEDAISFYEPRITVQNIIVEPEKFKNQYDITIIYVLVSGDTTPQIFKTSVTNV